jgi:hypothetical protein
MKYLVTVTPGPMPPPIEMVRAAREWVEERSGDGTFEAVYAFPEGGGMSISDHESHDALMDTLLDYPIAPFVQYDVKALVELNGAFDRFESIAEKMAEQMAGAAS